MSDLMSQAKESLISAITSGRVDVVQVLLSELEKSGQTQTADREHLLNHCFTQHGTVLHLAAATSTVDMVRALIVAGCNAALRNNNGESAYALSKSAEVKEVFHQDMIRAAATSSITSIKNLFSAGIRLDIVDSAETKNTPLHWACAHGNKETVELLCELGADVNAINARGKTPLTEAVERKSIEMIQSLLRHGAQFDLGADESRSKVTLYSTKRDSQPDSNQKPVNGMAPLQLDTPLTSPIRLKGDELGDHWPASPVKPEGPSFQDFATIHGKPVDSGETVSQLWPRPQSIRILNHNLVTTIGERLSVFISSTQYFEQIRQAWLTASLHFEANGIGLDICADRDQCGSHVVEFEMFKEGFSREEAYRLVIAGEKIVLVASCAAGGLYGAYTLLQLITIHREKDAGIPSLLIEDSPSFRYRGVLLDISQGRRPKHGVVESMLNCFSYLKLNQVHLYMRFHKAGVTWECPYSSTNVVDFTTICQTGYIDLIPAIDVTSDVFVEDLPALYVPFEKYLNSFPSCKFIHVGPWLSSLLVASDQPFSTLLPIRGGQHVMLCSHVLNEDDFDTSQIKTNSVCLEYGFQAGHDFEARCSNIVKRGYSFAACPGTAAWNSVAGNPEAAIVNVYNACQAALKLNGVGIVGCDWAGVGHLLSPLFRLPGYMVIAGLSWNAQTGMDTMHYHLSRSMARIFLTDDVTGHAHLIIAIGQIEGFIDQIVGGADIGQLPIEAGSSLFRLFSHPDSVQLENLTADVLKAVTHHMRVCYSQIKELKATDFRKELELALNLLHFSLRMAKALLSVGTNSAGQHPGARVINPGISNLANVTKTDLANRLLTLREQHRAVWQSRHLDNGLKDAETLFRTLMLKFVPEANEYMSAGSTS